MHGRGEPPAEAAQRIADQLGVDARWLVTGGSESVVFQAKAQGQVVTDKATLANLEHKVRAAHLAVAAVMEKLPSDREHGELLALTNHAWELIGETVDALGNMGATTARANQELNESIAGIVAGLRRWTHVAREMVESPGRPESSASAASVATEEGHPAVNEHEQAKR
jgi:hypothetical protein